MPYLLSFGCSDMCGLACQSPFLPLQDLALVLEGCLCWHPGLVWDYSIRFSSGGEGQLRVDGPEQDWVTGLTAQAHDDQDPG